MPSRKSYPVVMWHPETREPTTFDHPDDVPAGYLDHPAAAPAKPVPDEAETAVTLPLNRKEIRAELDEAGITYDKSAKTGDLYTVLVDALKAHLNEAEVEYPADADAKALLALVPKPD